MALRNGMGTVNGYKIGLNARLEEADLSGADLVGAKLIGAHLDDADLSNAILTDADLTDAELVNANLTSTDLTNSDLTYAILSGAILRDANFRRARLIAADLSDTDLSGADLTDADLRGANITNAIIDQDHVALFEAAFHKMLNTVTVNPRRTTNPALSLKQEQELLSILRKTRAVTKKVNTPEGSYYGLDFNATLARGLRNYEEETGKRPSKAVIARADRFFRIGEYDF